MITSGNATSFVRSLIGEATTKWWTDAEITLYLQFAMTRVQGEFYPQLWERNKTFADLSLVAGTQSYDEPADCFKISHIQEAATGRKLHQIGEDEYFKYKSWAAGTPSGWMYKDKHIFILPAPASTDSDWGLIWYMPAADEITDFPDSFRALVAVEAAILARGKNKEITADLFELQKMFRQSAIIDATMTTYGQVNVISDFSEESSFV